MAATLTKPRRPVSLYALETRLGIGTGGSGDVHALRRFLCGPTHGNGHRRLSKVKLREAVEKRIEEHREEIARMELWLERNS